jgi:hypothetical protein
MVGLAKKIKRKAWKSVLGEKSWTLHNEDFRAREKTGLVFRPNYAYGMLRAADTAAYFGLKAATVIEFGVASGAGLLNMVHLARSIEDETGIRLKVFGFDTGEGLPKVEGYKDHPELWNPGDFTMEDRSGLNAKIGDGGKIIWGDIENTAADFLAGVSPECPIGFISVDVDIYSGTKSALKILTGSTNKYLPAVSMYFDDVSFFFANRWAGELAAIEEYNTENSVRKIDLDRSLGGRPDAPAPWHNHMYACHLLDHASRQTPRNRQSLVIGDHFKFMSERNLF